jgi:TonB family protein
MTPNHTIGCVPRVFRFVSNRELRSLAATHAVVFLLICGFSYTSHAKQSQEPQSSLPQQQSKPQSFFGRIVSQNGVRFILRDDENNVWYHLDDQEKAAKLFGKDVLVTGTYDGVAGAIHVQNIVVAGPQDRPRPNIEDKKPDGDAPKMNETPPATVDANASGAPQSIPPPPLVITARAQRRDDPASAEIRASHHSPSEPTADPAPDVIPIPASFFSLPEEPVSATSTVAISSRRFIPMPPDSAPESEPPENLQVGKLLRLVKPSYPQTAQEQGVEGTVRIRASIAENGVIKSVEALSGPPVLAQASIAAVRDWRYGPTLLDGHRTPVEEEIRIVFRLAQ